MNEPEKVAVFSTPTPTEQENVSILSWTQPTSVDTIRHSGIVGFLREVVMVKSLLILMLVATQLLAGSGGSVYLCIDSNGSYCCFGVGSYSCTPCHAEEIEEIKVAQPVCCGGHLGAAFFGQNDEEPLIYGADSGAFVDDSCGCTNITIELSADQPKSDVRSLVQADVEQMTSLAALLSTFSGLNQAAAPLRPQRSDHSSISSFSLAVISTVVIRC